MSQRKDTGLNTNPWPVLLDHYTHLPSNDGVSIPFMQIDICSPMTTGNL